MRLSLRRGVAGLTLVAACFLMSDARVGLAQPPAAAVPLSDADFDKLVNHTRTLIQTSLKGDPNNNDAMDKAAMAARLLAALAHYSKDANNAKQRDAVRAVALKLADTIQNKPGNALKDAEKLVPAAVADKAAPPNLVDTQLTRDLMRHYTTKGIAGEAQLEKLERQASKGAVPAKLLNDDLLLLALKSAVAGAMLKDSTHNKVKKAPQAWKNYAEDLRKASIDLADAARLKNGPKALTAASNLNASCSACHDKFGK